jgi:hypothetical protein
VVARVGERVVRVQELDAWIKDRLFERAAGSSPTRLQAYRARQLPEMIDELVVAEEAARRGLSPEELLAEEVPADTEVTDDDVSAFQEQNPLAEALFRGREADVRRMLETKQTQGARQAYLDDLRERAGVRVEPAYRVARPAELPESPSPADPLHPNPFGSGSR